MSQCRRGMRPAMAAAETGGMAESACLLQPHAPACAAWMRMPASQPAQVPTHKMYGVRGTLCWQCWRSAVAPLPPSPWHTQLCVRRQGQWAAALALRLCGASPQQLHISSPKQRHTQTGQALLWRRSPALCATLLACACCAASRPPASKLLGSPPHTHTRMCPRAQGVERQ